MGETKKKVRLHHLFSHSPSRLCVPLCYYTQHEYFDIPTCIIIVFYLLLFFISYFPAFVIYRSGKKRNHRVETSRGSPPPPPPLLLGLFAVLFPRGVYVKTICHAGAKTRRGVRPGLRIGLRAAAIYRNRRHPRADCSRHIICAPSARQAQE